MILLSSFPISEFNANDNPSDGSKPFIARLYAGAIKSSKLIDPYLSCNAPNNAGVPGTPIDLPSSTAS